MGLGGVDQLLAVLLLEVPAGDGHRQRRGPDLAVLGNPDRGMPGDVIDLLRFAQEGVDALQRARARGTRLVLPDDVDLLAGVAGEALFGDVACRLRVRARRVVIGLELPLQGGADADDHDRSDDPCQHHAASAAIGDVGEAS
jgi:hypothetical protein